MEIDHKLKHWEKKWGWLALSRKDIEDLFHKVKGKRFDVIIAGERLSQRKIDRWRRVWLGTRVLGRFEVGDTLVCRNISTHVYIIKKR